MNSIYRKIYNIIKKYDNIVITRHVGPDPDALGSSIGLKEIIKNTFPKKNVYVVGCPAARFKYIGELDKMPEDTSKMLLIITDTPDKARIDSAIPNEFAYSIKIDHHPFVEKFCSLEFIDETASSASQLVMELAFNTKLKMNKEAASKLFLGLVSDTDRFLFSYTTPKTFNLVSRLIEETDLDFTKLYNKLYLRPIKEVRFRGYLQDNLKVTENGFGYIKIDEELLEKYGVDAATAGNMVNDFNYIEGVEAWAVFSYDKNNNNVRGSIRSRGPVINEVAAKYNGGGHKFASGVRLKNFEETDKIIKDLDYACKEYKESYTEKV